MTEQYALNSDHNFKNFSSICDVITYLFIPTYHDSEKELQLAQISPLLQSYLN